MRVKYEGSLSQEQRTLPSFVIMYCKTENSACHFTHKQFSRVIEKDLDLSLNMGLGTDTTCSNLNWIIQGGAKALENNIFVLQRQKTTPSLPAQPFLPGVASLSSFGCKISKKPESPATVPHSCPAYSQPFFPLLRTEHITWLQLPEDFAAIQENFIILCRRLVSIRYFEDNCSTTNSVLNPHLHFLEVLSN